eukprot:TRINITY_DN5395_c0_g1_i1.p1 TRINITY_DN5395_c0_g1~~TRINITY_DN5395_c0_g1_i1.p1  ORF type:complete len:262 (+),score=30.16 TRINITY_DN5395_c0_g1_i1:125-910(+)
MSNVAARQRWKLLSRAILHNKAKTRCVLSDPRLVYFEKRNLSSDETLGLACNTDVQVVEYSIKEHGRSVLIRYPSGSVSLQELVGFDNTGNVHIWPSEEMLGNYCVANAHLFRDRSVCELAAGCSGFAGLIVACLGNASKVLITDGNSQSVESIKSNIAINKDTIGDATHVEAKQLLWNREEAVNEGLFDFILAADCLFLEQYHSDLLHVLLSCLASDGAVLLFAPERGHSRENFFQKADSFFEIQPVQDDGYKLIKLKET